MATEETTYSRWYKKNRASFNEKRRKAYSESEELRHSAVARARAYRAANPRDKETRPHFRQVGGKQVEVFRIGAASELIGRSVQAIRQWEATGKIPKTSVAGNHRYYTKGQVKLLREFAEFVDQIRYDLQVRDLGIEQKSLEIHQNWLSVDGSNHD